MSLWAHTHTRVGYGLPFDGMEAWKDDPECPGLGSFAYREECDDPECPELAEEERERNRAWVAAEAGLAERLAACHPAAQSEDA